jgi:hypothetical protein
VFDSGGIDVRNEGGFPKPFIEHFRSRRLYTRSGDREPQLFDIWAWWDSNQHPTAPEPVEPYQEIVLKLSEKAE